MPREFYRSLEEARELAPHSQGEMIRDSARVIDGAPLVSSPRGREQLAEIERALAFASREVAICENAVQSAQETFNSQQLTAGRVIMTEVGSRSVKTLTEICSRSGTELRLARKRLSDAQQRRTTLQEQRRAVLTDADPQHVYRAAVAKARREREGRASC